MSSEKEYGSPRSCKLLNFTRMEALGIIALLLIPVLMITSISLIDMKIDQIEDEKEELLLEFELMWKTYIEFQTLVTRQEIVACNIDILKSLYNVTKSKFIYDTFQTYMKHRQKIIFNALMALHETIYPDRALSEEEITYYENAQWPEIDKAIMDLQDDQLNRIKNMSINKFNIDEKIIKENQNKRNNLYFYVMAQIIITIIVEIIIPRRMRAG